MKRKRYDISVVSADKFPEYVFENKEYLDIVEKFMKKRGITTDDNYIIGFEYINKQSWKLFIEIEKL